jgi:nicotinate-nucleotide adenylyltransferase
LRIVPAGNPWQKSPLRASPQDRVAMLELAFDGFALPLTIDTQEIDRQGPSYSIDTLRALRAELGPDVSLAFLLGADQLQQLHTWREWQRLFDYAHLCAAARPGFSLEDVQAEVREELSRRAGTPEQISTHAHGLVCLLPGLAIDISSTAARAALEQGKLPPTALPPAVLDYIQDHHLYRP